MWRVVIGLCSLLAACHSPQRIDLCRRGDRLDLDAFRISAFDGSGALLERWETSARGTESFDGSLEGVRRLRIDGLDSSGATVAIGEGEVTDPDAACVCIASTAQHPIACRDVACRVLSGSCAFTEPSGLPVGARTFWFGNNTADDVTGVAEDTYLDVATPANNYGADPVIRIESESSLKTRVGLWRFELAAIPTTAQIESATLAVSTGVNGTANPIDFYAVLEPWQAGTLQNAPGCSNWTCRLDGPQAWTTDGVGPGSRGTDVLVSLLDASSPLTRFELSSPAMSPRLRDLVQAWASDPSMNHGITARIRDQPTGSVELVSSEGADTSRPSLGVELVIP